MPRAVSRDPIYRRRRYSSDVIELCVRWYITYRLSYRDLVAMMAERGVAVSHTTILRWVLKRSGVRTSMGSFRSLTGAILAHG